MVDKPNWLEAATWLLRSFVELNSRQIPQLLVSSGFEPVTFGTCGVFQQSCPCLSGFTLVKKYSFVLVEDYFIWLSIRIPGSRDCMYVDFLTRGQLFPRSSSGFVQDSSLVIYWCNFKIDCFMILVTRLPRVHFKESSMVPYTQISNPLLIQSCR